MGRERVCDDEILGRVGGPWYHPWQRRCGGWKTQCGRRGSRGCLSRFGSKTNGEKHGQDFGWTYHLRTAIAAPTLRQGKVVGGRRHKECCVVGGEGRQERRDEIVDYRKGLGGKERSWTKTTYCDIRRAARKHKSLHHAILGGNKGRRLENTQVRTTQLCSIYRFRRCLYSASVVWACCKFPSGSQVFSADEYPFQDTR